MSTPGAYWFAAKRYGWGWGAPLTWQGWAVLGAYFLLVMPIGVVLFLLNGRIAPYLALVVFATAALLFICSKKGEPPRWRWGGDDQRGAG